MSSEEKNDQGGKKLSRFLVVGLVIVVLLLGSAYGLVRYLSAQADQDEAPIPGPMYQLEPFYVNLTEPRGRAILKVVVVMDLNDGNIERELEHFQPVLRDEIIAILRSRTPGQLQEPDEYERLKVELTERINEVLPRGGVSAVYFTEFIITQ